MATVPGWQMWSNIDGYTNPDFVYRSLGSSGHNDIYIRQCSNHIEHFVKGDDQYDYGGGDTGQINFFSYLFYPQDGDAYSGASEVGNFGPRLYYIDANDPGHKWYRQDFLSQRIGGSSHVATGTPFEELEPDDGDTDPVSEENRRWHELTQGPIGTTPYGKVLTTDNKSSLYFGMDTGEVYRYGFARGGGHYDNTGTLQNGELLADFSGLGYSISFLTWYLDRLSRTPYLFVMGTDSAHVAKINLVTGLNSSISSPSWPARATDDGSDSTQQNSGASCWDGGQFIYVLRGGDAPTGGFGFQTNFPDWGIYDILNDTWKTTETPEDPSFRYLDGSAYLDYKGYSLTFINKNISGFSNNRIYYIYDDELWYLELEDNGLPLTSDPTWKRQGYISAYANDGEIFYSRHNRIFNIPFATHFSINGVYERFPVAQNRVLLFADLEDSGSTSLNWKMSDVNYFPSAANSRSRRELVDGHTCRVRTGIDASTNYIFVGDSDRIIVATQSAQVRGNIPSNQLWQVAYMGSFDTNYPETPYAEFADNVNAGVFRKIRLKNRIGEFESNFKYFVSGTSGPSETKTYYPDGRSRKIGYSESVVVSHIDEEYIVATLRNNYNAGAKIGIDPNPSGVFLWQQEMFQATNIAPRLPGDYNGSDDPSKQLYSIPISETEVISSTATAIAANGIVPVESLNLVSGVESEGSWNAREVRGRLKGMYVIGKTSGVDSGHTIALSDGSYKILGIEGYNSKYLLIGPLVNE